MSTVVYNQVYSLFNIVV